MTVLGLLVPIFLRRTMKKRKTRTKKCPRRKRTKTPLAEAPNR